MNCPNCNQPLTLGASFCSNCGASVKEDSPAFENPETAPVQSEPAPQSTVSYAPQPAKENEIPRRYAPLKPWQYFWLQILFAIPIVGFVFLIVFSCSSANLNRRSFARSYWCWLIVALIIAIVTLIVLLLLVHAFGVNLNAF